MDLKILFCRRIYFENLLYTKWFKFTYFDSHIDSREVKNYSLKKKFNLTFNLINIIDFNFI